MLRSHPFEFERVSRIPLGPAQISQRPSLELRPTPRPRKAAPRLTHARGPAARPRRLGSESSAAVDSTVGRARGARAVGFAQLCVLPAYGPANRHRQSHPAGRRRKLWAHRPYARGTTDRRLRVGTTEVLHTVRTGSAEVPVRGGGGSTSQPQAGLGLGGERRLTYRLTRAVRIDAWLRPSSTGPQQARRRHEALPFREPLR